MVLLSVNGMSKGLSGHRQVVINHQSDVNLKTGVANNPLHAELYFGYAEIADMLRNSSH